VKVKIFKSGSERLIQEWLDQVGNIKIQHTTGVNQTLIIFYEGGGVVSKPRFTPARPSFKVGPPDPDPAPCCPSCGSPMRIRSGTDLFWGCVCFPDCNGTRSLSAVDEEQMWGKVGTQERLDLEDPDAEER